MCAPTRRARRRALAAASLGALAWTSAARAQAPCPVTVVPPGTPGWEAAAQDARQRLQAPAATPLDCASIRAVVLPSGAARLEFTTTEGRRAERQLQAPEELGPAIEALLVTVAPVAEPSPQKVMAAAPPKATPPEDSSTQSAQTPGPRVGVRPHLLIGGGLGTRVTFGHKYAAPGGALRATGVFDRWELGVSGEWDVLFARLKGKTPAGFAMSALVVGALFGRRERLGHFELSYGLDLGIGSVASSADPQPGLAANRSVDASQQRVGLYAGGRYPRAATTRVTLDVNCDAALSGLRPTATSAAALPPFARYGVGLWLGVETVAL